MKLFNVWRIILLAAVVALPMSGCAKKPAPETATISEAPAVTEAAPSQEAPKGYQDSGVRESMVTEGPKAGEGAGQAAPAAEAAQSLPELQRIFFDYDQYTLTPEARQTLAANSEFMKQRAQAAFVIEGHSDERGSDEYNLALGERRAKAARDYLISLGVAGDRLSTISYGEERPLEQASGEEGWAKNRRAEFVLR
jgi:peptidoglycan-associated lipoprotein